MILESVELTGRRAGINASNDDQKEEKDWETHFTCWLISVRT